MIVGLKVHVTKTHWPRRCLLSRPMLPEPKNNLPTSATICRVDSYTGVLKSHSHISKFYVQHTCPFVFSWRCCPRFCSQTPLHLSPGTLRKGCRPILCLTSLCSCSGNDQVCVSSGWLPNRVSSFPGSYVFPSGIVVDKSRTRDFFKKIGVWVYWVWV